MRSDARRMIEGRSALNSKFGDSTCDSLWPFLEGVKSKNDAAREALLKHSQQRLARMTKKMLRKYPGVLRWEDVGDVLQNVLIRLDRSLREVEPPTPADFLALASAHIRWELIDLSRRHNGPTGVNALYLTPATDERGSRRQVDPAAPDEDPLGLEIWSELHARIEAMPDGARQLFDALFYRGLPQPEAALVLGIPLRTLRRRWKAAREKLMREFGQGMDLQGFN